jgi:hypothetical protein
MQTVSHLQAVLSAPEISEADKRNDDETHNRTNSSRRIKITCTLDIPDSAGAEKAPWG